MLEGGGKGQGGLWALHLQCLLLRPVTNMNYNAPKPKLLLTDEATRKITFKI